MKPLTRRPGFWLAFVLLSIGSLAVAVKVFPLAIPLVNLDIRLARHEALAKAARIAAREKLAPADARSAVQFAQDGATQNYVELEGGGKPAFAALVAGNRYAPFWWDVRLFRPGDVDEVTIRFKPDGSLNGFSRRLPETYVRDPATKALDRAAARALAEARAAGDWEVDLAPYRLIEQSEQTRPTGRVDHAFVYERAEELGEARIRLRLAVSGDELTGVAPYVKIPESFGRRFQEMRSTNNLIAGVASVAAGLLYGVGGLILGVLWLLRRHWLVWRPALVAGLTVGGLLAAASLASAPAAWMSFDTAQSVSTFWLQRVGGAVAVVIGGGAAYAAVFMAAESLSRCAFPHQPQLWRLWSNAAGASVQTLGRTLGGYLFVPVELALIALFYYATNRWLGWWQPSEALTDPNILSSAVPALQPIALALQAGFMEECAFRAIPLALGALIGQRYGARGAGIAIAFFVQAFVFAGAHANYPGLPAYSRLVELLVPSMLWALIFLRFGLLPTILLHALFDLVLMSIPVFLVDAPGAEWQRALVIVAGAAPLLLVLVRRLRRGRWIELPARLRNGAWQPAQPMHREPVARPHIAHGGLVSAFRRWLPLLGAAGAIAWIASARVGTDVPPLAVDRTQAIGAAEQALRARDVALDGQWQRLAAIRLAGNEPPHAFVWREAGAERYRAIVGSFLAPPLWDVRFARFEGDVAERAEEWRVAIDGAGAVRGVRHLLPEGRAGARLDRAAALAIATAAVGREVGIDAAALRLVAGEDRSLPARTDWTFVWSDPGVDVGKDGEARVQAWVAGETAVGVSRFVHVPESWLRAEREREGRLTAARIVGMILGAVAALAALILGIVRWSRRQTDARATWIVGGIALVLAIARIPNGWPNLLMSLNTAEPVASQLAMSVLSGLLGGLFVAVVSGVLAGVGVWDARASIGSAGRKLQPWIAGLLAALALEGLSAWLGRIVPANVPDWPAYPFEETARPLLAALLSGLHLPIVVAIALFLLAFLARVTGAGRRRGWLLLLVLASLFTMQAAGDGVALQAAVVVGIVLGAASVLLFQAVLRADARSVPAFVATALVLGAANGALEKATLQGYVLGAIECAVVVAAAWLCTRYLGSARAVVSDPAPAGEASRD